MTAFYPRISPKYPATVSLFETAFKKESARDLEATRFRALVKLLSRRGPLVRRNKRKAPLASRALCEGRRKKANLAGPLLCLLDADEVDLSPEDAHARLSFFGVTHWLHTTWSHDPERTGKHSYRVFLDATAEDEEGTEDVARQAFRVLGLEPTPESWTTPCVFVPTVHPDREDQYQSFQGHFDRGSDWRPKRTEVGASKEKKERRAQAHDDEVDPQELREALSRVPNEERPVWIEMGMALRSTGLEQAREIWDEWSAGQGYAKYSDQAQEAAWSSFGDEGGTTVASVYWHARKGGWRPKQSRASAVEDFERFLAPLARHLHRMNRQYAYVWLGRGAIASTGDRDQPVDFRPVQGFLDHYRHPKYETGARRRDGSMVEESVGKLWMNWKKRRTYKNVDFLPENDDEALPPTTLNTWKGWRHEPEPRSCDAFLKHVREVVCGGNEDLYDWVVAWTAHMVQRPHEKPGTAIVMRGSEGTGKGLFASALVELCGVHGVHVTQPGQLTGSFNRHLMGKLFVFADEVTWGGRHQEEGVLKALITEKKLMVEPKGVDAFMTRNFLRVAISSNHEWVVPAGPSARRFQVMDVGESRLGDKRYFQSVLAELENGGYSGLMRFLRGARLDRLPDPTEVIHTEALTHQKLQSLDTIDSWLLQVLHDGEACEGLDGWPESVPTKLFYDGYLAFARDLGAPRRSVEMLVARRLQEVFRGEVRKVKRMRGGERSYRWELPALERAQELFEGYLKTKISWGEPERPKRPLASVLE